MFQIEQFQKNYTEVEAELAALNLEKTPKILVVTKYLSVEAMKELYQAGYRNFGENRAKDLLEKQAALPYTDIEWHFIGRLQTRPVRKMIHSIDYLHSLDRPSLAKEIQKRRESPLDCYLQVNVTGETSKTGIELSDLEEIILHLAEYPQIRIVGLMTMAIQGDSEANLRQTFSRLKKAQEKIAAKHLAYAPCQEVSMGMSHDYLIAAQEGATILRIGSRLYQGME